MRIIKIGKASSNDIVIDGDSTVSRIHMQMFIDDEANVFVTDLNSMNGTFVNGIKISESVKLNTYDILRVGNSLVNWKEFLLDDIDAQDAYKTIADENKKDLVEDVVEFDDQFDDNQNTNDRIKRKKKKKYLWYIVIASIVFVGVYMYLNSHSQLILDKWTSVNNSDLSYTFNNDGTFVKDSSDIIKNGTYSLVDGRNKKLELVFDDKSLPVFEKSFISENSPKHGFPDSYKTITEVTEEYFGNLFELKNNSKYSIKIIGVDHDFFNRNIADVETRVYTCEGSYNNLRPINSEYDENWKYFDSEKDFQLMRDAKLSNEIIIPQEESISFFILSNCCVNITFLDDIVNMSENNDIELSNSVKSQTYESQLYFHKEQLVWNGKIIYGLMRSEYNYSYKFEDSYLEINGELFKKN
jgi:hypothetical protein